MPAMRTLTAIALGMAAVAFVPARADAEPFFRFNSTFRGAAPGGPTTPETPESPQSDTLDFARSAFSGERNVSFGTGEPTSSLPTPIDFSLAAESSPLPDGLIVDRTSGEISGTPSEIGTFPNIVIAGVSGARSAKSAPTSIVITGIAPGADEVMPSLVTLPGAGSSRLNVSHLLGQYVPMGKPSLLPGASLEIIYSQPVQVDGVHMSTLASSPRYRVEYEQGGSWPMIGSELTQAKGGQPIPLGRTVTASRFRIVNTGTTTLNNLTTGLSYRNNWMQLPWMTVNNRSGKLTVGQSFSGDVSLYTGSTGYGYIPNRAPYTYALVPRPVDLPYVEDVYFQHPDGIGIDAATGFVSGTATSPTWSPWKYSNLGLQTAQNSRATYISATDASGYTVYGWGRGFVVDSPVSAGTALPYEITINGTPVTSTQRSDLAILASSIQIPGDSKIIAKFSGMVSAGTIRTTFNGYLPSWNVYFSQDQGAHWMHVADTETVNGSVVTLALADPQLGTGTGSATGSWIMIIPTSAVTLRGFAIGKDGVFPAP